MKFPTIDEQISFLLQQMEKAMPEVKRQVEVYEQKLRMGKIALPKTAPPFKNV